MAGASTVHRRRTELERLNASSGEGALTDLHNIGRHMAHSAPARDARLPTQRRSQRAPDQAEFDAGYPDLEVDVAALPPPPELYARCRLAAGPAGKPTSHGGLGNQGIKDVLGRYNVAMLNGGGTQVLRQLLAHALEDGRIPQPTAASLLAAQQAAAVAQEAAEHEVARVAAEQAAAVVQHAEQEAARVAAAVAQEAAEHEAARVAAEQAAAVVQHAAEQEAARVAAADQEQEQEQNTQELMRDVASGLQLAGVRPQKRRKWDATLDSMLLEGTSKIDEIATNHETRKRMWDQLATDLDRTMVR